MNGHNLLIYYKPFKRQNIWTEFYDPRKSQRRFFGHKLSKITLSDGMVHLI